jgi:hypothetical protein
MGASEPWEAALARMPLKTGVRQLNRTNCVELMLAAFQSNAVAKALIFMPGATDEFYMFRRAEAELTGAAPSLLDAVSALTNQTLIRATFRGPLLLLHTDEDPLEPDGRVEHAGTAEELRHLHTVPHVLWNDRDWDAIQPLLRARLKVDLRPWRGSKDSWHFYRHSLAGWDLNGYEALEATALAGKSKFLVKRGKVIFEPDPRVRATPPGEWRVTGAKR